MGNAIGGDVGVRISEIIYLIKLWWRRLIYVKIMFRGIKKGYGALTVRVVSQS